MATSALHDQYEHTITGLWNAAVEGESETIEKAYGHSLVVMGRAREGGAGSRFAFGKNWEKFIENIDERRINEAVGSLQQMLKIDHLKDKRFLDIGSGSGLFSLAARRLGACVHSFDHDAESVACTMKLKKRYYPNDKSWIIEQASVLDVDYMSSIGQFEVVYSWGVLHHTGEMWKAMDCARRPVAAGGQLYVAIYNDQGWISRYWLGIKKAYNHNLLSRYAIIAVHAPLLVSARFMVRAVRGAISLERGMSIWRDMIDWLGGYPFETATPPQVVSFYAGRGMKLVTSRTVGTKLGCNEFVFQRPVGRDN